MKTTRNTPTAFRFDPSVKQALDFIADREGRSKANMLEWLIRKHCEREGLGWPPVPTIVGGADPVTATGAMAKSTANAAGKPPASKNSKSGK